MKIPEQAKSVFKGNIFEVFQWPQTMFDGSVQTFEMLKRPNTVIVIAASGSSIFIGEEEQPNKPVIDTLFGGRVEVGEDTLEAAKRELLEEAGLASDDWELYKTYQPVIKIEWQIFLYIARNCQCVAEQRLDAGERIKVKEVGFEEFVDVACSDRFGEKEFAFDLMRMRLAPDHDEQLAAFKKTVIGQ